MNRPSPDDTKAMQVMEYVTELEMKNKKLKEKLALTENDRDEWEVKAKDLLKENKELKEKLEEVTKELIQHHEEYKNMADMVVELESENKTLKKKLDILYHHV